MSCLRDGCAPFAPCARCLVTAGRCGRPTISGKCGDWRPGPGLGLSPADRIWCGICQGPSPEREKRRAEEVAGLHGQPKIQQSVPAARAAELATLREHRRVYIEYARHRIDDEDWHGVSDAANDLRELDVEIRMLEAAKP